MAALAASSSFSDLREQFRSFVQGLYVPVVLVVTSPEANRVCERNNTKFIDLLKPYSILNTRVPVRTLNDVGYELHDFRLRFVEPSFVDRSTPAALEEQQRNLRDLVARSASEEVYANFKIREKADVPYFLRACKGQDPTPWFNQFRWEFLRSLGISDHETLDHPLAVFCVVSSANPAPVQTAMSLFPTGSLYRDGPLDANNVLRVYVMLHDARERDVSHTIADQKFHELKTAFGPAQCVFVRLNSLADEPPSTASPGGPQLLSPSDLAALRDVVVDFGMRLLVPHMERQMRQLAEQIAGSKKGILPGRIRSWLRFGNKPAAAGAAGADGESDSQSAMGAVERQLADLAFLLRDYETAVVHYKAAIAEFKSNSPKHYAGALEGHALSYMLVEIARGAAAAGTPIGGPPGGLHTALVAAEGLLDNSYTHYQRTSQWRYAVRTTFWLVELLRARNNFRDAAKALVRAADLVDVDDLCAALLHEQAAFSFVQCSPPQFRKFGFRLCLAGQSFARVDQVKHALRCFRAAHAQYEGRDWPAIDAFLSLKLGRASFLLNKIDDSLAHLHRLLERSPPSWGPGNAASGPSTRTGLPPHLVATAAAAPASQSDPARQAACLREYLFVYRAFAEISATSTPTKPLPQLPLPILHNHSLKVYLTSFTPDDEADSVVCRAMEAALVSPPSTRRQPPTASGQSPAAIRRRKAWRYAAMGLPAPGGVSTNGSEPVGSSARGTAGFGYAAAYGSTAATSNEPRTTVIGEYIHVEVDIENPLFLPLQLSRVQLLPAGFDTAAAVAAEGERPYEVDEVDILLGPGERATLRLSILPRTEGPLELKGIRFLIGGPREAGGVWGHRDFSLKPRLVRRPGSRQAAYEPDMRLSFSVCGPMPFLAIDVPGWTAAGTVSTSTPEQPVVLHGEVRRLVMQVTNLGKVAMRNCRIKLSHPAFFSFADPADVDMGDTWRAGSSAPPVADVALPPHLLNDPSVVSLADWVPSLPPDTAVHIPVFFRGAALGLHKFFFVFYYEPDAPSSCSENRLKFRVQHISFAVRVVPAIEVTFSSQPSLASLNEYVLGVDVKNVASPDVAMSTSGAPLAFRLLQLSAVSPRWTIEPLSYEQGTALANGAAESNPFVIGPAESTSAFFKIRPAALSSVSTVPSPDLRLIHTNLPFGEKRFDTATLPFNELLHRDILVDDTLSPGVDSSAAASGEENPNVLDLLLLWETADSMRIGQYHVQHIRFLPSDEWAEAASVSTLPLPTAGSVPSPSAPAPTDAHLPLRFLIESPSNVFHNFGVQPFCIVKLHVHVLNSSPTNPLSFYFETLKPNEAVPLAGAASAAAASASPGAAASGAVITQTRRKAQYFWPGVTRYHIADLAPGDQRTFEVDACFSKPGVYNLNRFKFLVQLPSKAHPWEVYSPIQHLITVEEEGAVTAMGTSAVMDDGVANGDASSLPAVNKMHSSSSSIDLTADELAAQVISVS